MYSTGFTLLWKVSDVHKSKMTLIKLSTLCLSCFTYPSIFFFLFNILSILKQI